MSDALATRVRTQCRGQADGTEKDGFGVLMEPLRRGDALLFLSVLPENGTILPHMYHGGCPVLGSSRIDKVTLQKFKEAHAPSK